MVPPDLLQIDALQPAGKFSGGELPGGSRRLTGEVFPAVRVAAEPVQPVQEFLLIPVLPAVLPLPDNAGEAVIRPAQGGDAGS